MKIEDFFNKQNIIDLSFFNFSNAITACYYAKDNLEVLKVNDNFLSFFPILGNVNNVYFPDVLEQIGLPGKQIEEFVRDINENGTVLIPEVKISINDEERVYSLLSTRTKNDSFSYLNGVQGQFVDRTAEFNLRKERQNLLEEKIRDREIMEDKSRQLADLAFFKQKTAYEIGVRLVGSEMCIRDSNNILFIEKIFNFHKPSLSIS